MWHAWGKESCLQGLDEQKLKERDNMETLGVGGRGMLAQSV